MVSLYLLIYFCLIADLPSLHVLSSLQKTAALL
uniref:Uncharacterized protein n=1 Tax=Arundo donax TaxID=35708 RepID=A0A0A9BL19_ARUDO